MKDNINIEVEKMIPLSKEKIDKIFEEAEDQAHALIMLYEVPHPNWDNIKKLKGFPKVHSETALYIGGKFIEFDREHHPDVFAGGLWMNRGFSTDSRLNEWEVKPAQEVY